MHALFVATNAVNFAGLALGLWLGFFNLARSPQRRLTRVAALTLWASTGFFLSNLMYYNRLPEMDNAYWLALFRWSTLFIPALWMHLTSSWLPDDLYRKRRLIALAAYIIAASLTAFDTITPVLLKPSNPTALSIEGYSKTPNFLFPLYIGYLSGCALLAWLNLLQARARASAAPGLHHSIGWAMRGTLLAGAGGLYLTASIQLGLPLPNVFGDLAFASGVMLMGYAVAQAAAWLDGRSVQRDFLYTLLVIMLVCGAYLVATLLSYVVYGIPFVTFIFVLMFAVITHSIYDWVRTTLDRFFFREPTRELRANLRALAHEASGDQAAQQNLRALLTTLCQSIGAARGALLLRQNDQFVVDATYRMSAPALLIPPTVVSAQELTPLQDKTMLGDMALLAPLYLMAQQEGAIVLGPKANGGTYSAAAEDLIVEVADRMESVIAQFKLREERTRQLNEQLARYRESERELQQPIEPVKENVIALPGYSEKEFVGHVEDALRHLRDITYLGEHPLSHLQVVARRLNATATTNLDRGKALKEALLEALNKLRPAETPEPKQPGSEWYPYLILREAYVVDVPNREIMARLYISEGTFNRTRRRAIRAVARALAEMEQALMADSR